MTTPHDVPIPEVVGHIEVSKEGAEIQFARPALRGGFGMRAAMRQLARGGHDLVTMADAIAYADARCAALQAEQARITVDVYQQDWIPAFAAFLDDGSLQAGARPKIAINIGALMAAVASGDIDKAELPYVVAETMMHEIIHVLESWAGVEFSEDRVDALIEKYRQDAAIDAASGDQA